MTHKQMFSAIDAVPRNISLEQVLLDLRRVIFAFAGSFGTISAAGRLVEERVTCWL